jgi:sec-independent protein translocase protein TatC
MSTGVPDPDDFFADTRMSFADHIEDLRSHLWRAIKGFLVAMVFSFFIGRAVVEYITAPVKEQLREFYNRRVKTKMEELKTDPALQKANEPAGFTPMMFRRDQFLAAVKGAPAAQVNAFKQPVLPPPDARAADDRTMLDKLLGRSAEKEPENPDLEVIDESNVYYLWAAPARPLQQMANMQEAMRIVGDFDTMSTLNVQEAFMVWFKVCILCGLVLGSPWIFFQVWRFVAAGLYPHEKRYVHVYLPLSLFLFLGGVAVCELAVIPKAIEALLWFNEWMGFKPDLRLNEWLGFAIFMPVVFGISFQTPLVMLFLAKVGFMDADGFRRKRRYIWFFMAVFAAIITPSVDAVSMLLLWLPMSLLFELGIVLITWSGRHRSDLDIDVPEPEEMIEV